MDSFMWLFLIFAGLFSIGGAAFEWGFFMNHHKAKSMVSLVGRNGARVFYIVLGLAIAGIGAGGLIGVLQ